MNLERMFSRIARGIVYLPKTIYINFCTLPFKKAIKFPYIVMGPCSFKGVNRRTIILEGPVKTGMIRLAAQKTSKRGVHVNRKAYLIADDNGSITFHGEASIGAGTSICAHGGKIDLGDKFSCNINCFLYCMEYIKVGSNVLLGWNINIRDNDGHPLYQNGELLNPNKGIHLSDRIWIASYVDIMKGVSLAEGTIIGTRSLVTKSTDQPRTLIAGVPAKVIKSDITWDYEYKE